MRNLFWRIGLFCAFVSLPCSENAQLVDTILLEKEIHSLRPDSDFASLRKRLELLVEQNAGTAARLSLLGSDLAETPQARLIFLNNLAYSLISQANFKEAKITLTLAESLAQDNSLQEYLSAIYLNWGNLYWKSQDLEAGLMAADSCAAFAKADGDEFYYAKSKTLRGWLLRLQGKNEEAFAQFERALEYFEKNGHSEAAASALNGMGATSFMMENLSAAVDYWLAAKGDAIQNGQLSLVQNILSNLGFLYLRLEKMESAKAALYASLSLAEQTNDLAGITNVSYNLAELLQHTGQPDSARIFCQRTLEFGEKVGDKIRLAGAHMVLSDLDIEEGNLESAEVHSASVINLSEQSGDVYTKGYGIFQQGQIASLMGHHQTALDYFEKALAIFEQTGELGWQAEATKNISKSYEEMHQPQLALDFFKKSTLLNDSIRTSEILQKITTIEKQFQLEKKEEEIAHLAAQNDLLKINGQKNRYIIGGLVLLLLLGGLVFMQAYRQRKLSLEKGLAEVKQQLLRQQMNPHFIFNSLNSVQNQFLKGDATTSLLIMAKFSKLMRLVLNNSNETFVPIHDELELLRLYLDLEQLRTNQKFHYVINVDEKVDIYNTSLPSMVTQIFVENAIWHGIAPKGENGEIILDIAKQDGLTVFSVEDNGVGRKYSLRSKSNTQKEHRSLGIELVKERIRQINRKFTRNIRMFTEDLEDVDGTATGTRIMLIF